MPETPSEIKRPLESDNPNKLSTPKKHRSSLFSSQPEGKGPSGAIYDLATYVSKNTDRIYHQSASETQKSEESHEEPSEEPSEEFSKEFSKEFGENFEINTFYAQFREDLQNENPSDDNQPSNPIAIENPDTSKSTGSPELQTNDSYGLRDYLYDEEWPEIPNLVKETSIIPQDIQNFDSANYAFSTSGVHNDKILDNPNMGSTNIQESNNLPPDRYTNEGRESTSTDTTQESPQLKEFHRLYNAGDEELYDTISTIKANITAYKSSKTKSKSKYIKEFKDGILSNENKDKHLTHIIEVEKIQRALRILDPGPGKGPNHIFGELSKPNESNPLDDILQSKELPVGDRNSNAANTAIRKLKIILNKRLTSRVSSSIESQTSTMGDDTISMETDNPDQQSQMLAASSHVHYTRQEAVTDADPQIDQIHDQDRWGNNWNINDYSGKIGELKYVKRVTRMDIRNMIDSHNKNKSVKKALTDLKDLLDYRNINDNTENDVDFIKAWDKAANTNDQLKGPMNNIITSVISRSKVVQINL